MFQCCVHDPILGTKKEKVKPPTINNRVCVCDDFDICWWICLNGTKTKSLTVPNSKLRSAD